jgi:hypothetical protein
VLLGLLVVAAIVVAAIVRMSPSIRSATPSWRSAEYCC